MTDIESQVARCSPRCSKRPILCCLGRGTESLRTLRWREPDSNRRYRVTQPRFRGRPISPLLDHPLTEKSARTRTDNMTTPGRLRGTDGSNPGPSSDESAANLTADYLIGVGVTSIDYRMVDASEIAFVAVFLASDKA